MSLSTSSLPSSTGPQTASPVSFNLQGTYSQQQPQSSQSPPPMSHSAPPRQNTMPNVKTRTDEEHSKLASLFANREDGIDTFGNFGALRYVSSAVRSYAFTEIVTDTASRRASSSVSSRLDTTRLRSSSNNSSSKAVTSRSSQSRHPRIQQSLVSSRPRALVLSSWHSPTVPGYRELIVVMYTPSLLSYFISIAPFSVYAMFISCLASDVRMLGSRRGAWRSQLFVSCAHTNCGDHRGSYYSLCA